MRAIRAVIAILTLITCATSHAEFPLGGRFCNFILGANVPEYSAADWPVIASSSADARVYRAVLSAFLQRQAPDFSTFNHDEIFRAMSKAFYSQDFLTTLKARIAELSGGRLSLEATNDIKPAPYGPYLYLKLISRLPWQHPVYIGFGPRVDPIWVFRPF